MKAKHARVPLNIAVGLVAMASAGVVGATQIIDNRSDVVSGAVADDFIVQNRGTLEVTATGSTEGIDVRSRSTLIVNAGTVAGGGTQVGIALSDQSKATLVDTTVTGGTFGVSGNTESRMQVQGGTIIGNNGASFTGAVP